MSSYYNTNSLQGTALAKACQKARSQKDAIRAIFKAARGPGTPSMVKEAYEKRTGKRILLSSVRRSMSDLTDEDFLIKLDKQKFNRNTGGYEHYWRKA